jgi:opacity protein-like surface antigen
MRRIAVIAVAAALFATTGAVAVAAETESDPGTSEAGVLSEAQLWGTSLLAGYFVDRFENEDAAVTAITDLRTGDMVIGWGAMFKLFQLAELEDLSLAALLGDIEGDGRGWAFGYRFKEFAGDHPYEASDDTPKNFGQLKKQGRASQGNQGKKP